MSINSVSNSQTIVNNFFIGGAPTTGAVSPKELLATLRDLFAPQTGGFDPLFTKPELNPPTIPAPVETPILEDGVQPKGSLKADGNKVTTAGGYSIEVLGTSEWKITGPDGKSTRIWGDPHVHESDAGDAEGRGGWDFKRNSTFVLGDGTKINVTTVPGGAAGATVTGGLEIISGNDRVVASDMEKGKSNFGTVTQDGFAKANSFQGDVFVMGKESDDWSFEGKEIIGSENQGEKFKTGNALGTGTQTPTRATDPLRGNQFQRQIGDILNRFRDNMMMTMGRALMNIFSRGFQPSPSPLGSNPYTGNTRSPWETGNNYNRVSHRQNLTQSLQQMSKMFNVLAQLSQLNDSFQSLRDRSFATRQG